MKKFWRNNRKAIGFIAVLFVCWQAVLIILNLIAPLTPIAYRGGFNYSEVKVKNPPFFWNWASFDGIHYLDIAKKGYGIHQQAFFPLYPGLIKKLTPVLAGKDLLAGLFISNFSLVFLLFLFYQLIVLDYDELTARRSIVYLLLFPTAFFLGMVYTESLFLLLAVGCFYWARKSKWLLAAIFGGLASYTRLVGIFLFPALVWEFYSQIRSQDPKYKILSSLPIFLVPWGLLTYMRFLWVKYHDPLMFLHVQPFFGAERSGGKIILLYQVFWRYLKMIATTKPDPLYFTVWLELLTAVGFLFLVITALRKKVRLSYLIFAALAYLAPTFSGTFSSLPRYVLVLFPCFMVLGTTKSQFLRNLILIGFGLGFVGACILFFRGYWIS